MTEEQKRICMECGQTFNTKDMLKVGRKMYCKECSEYILEEQSKNKHLHTGGINIVNQQTTNLPTKETKQETIVVRNHTTAIILSIFLGMFGADRFYVGHIGLEILKFFLLFTIWGGIIWWIIDIILFATKNVRNVEWE